MLKLLMFVLSAYLVGAIPFGLLFARVITGKDPRQHGSGNIGATNAMRTGGKLVGILTLLADIAKASIPVAFALYYANELTAALVGVAAFVGHVYPVYLGFRGGKGVATMFGALIPWQPWIALLAFAVWLLVLQLGRYVSVASIAAAVSMPLLAVVFDGSVSLLVACVLFAAISIAKHRSNLVRVAKGEEPKIGQGKKTRSA